MYTSNTTRLNGFKCKNSFLDVEHLDPRAVPAGLLGMLGSDSGSGSSTSNTDGLIDNLNLSSMIHDLTDLTNNTVDAGSNHVGSGNHLDLSEIISGNNIANNVGNIGVGDIDVIDNVFAANDLLSNSFHDFDLGQFSDVLNLTDIADLRILTQQYISIKLLIEMLMSCEIEKATINL